MRQLQGTRSGKTSSANTSTPVAAGTSSNNSATSSACGCGCQDHAVADCGCCKLTCFERPKYFCGQLLSDADLTLQETYFREKNKLYHRTMDGSGVVCGLRMSRDFQCKGNVLVGDGFAIDPCGNDLVVCDPRSFNVIAELRRKNWLVEMPIDRSIRDQGFRQPLYTEDTGEPRQAANDDEDDCINTQCFYIGICYTEESVDFATPYMTECSPAPGPCQPTRIREGVRFEIYDKMPVRPNPLDDIGKSIEACFKMFREGQFARSLASMTTGILAALNCDQQTDTKQKDSKQPDVQDLFRTLQSQFLHELRTSPDQYNCDLDRQVMRLRPPDQTRAKQDAGIAPPEAFTSLFELIQKYVFTSVLSQLAFSCPKPSESSCVLIGSVEIENGLLKRVLNYPRWYLWCFANFFEVLLYTMANDGACGKDAATSSAQNESQKPKPANQGCGPAYEVDVCQFLNLFSADQLAFEKAARSSVDAIQASYRALVAGFNFTRPGGIAPSVLRNLDLDKAQGLTDMLGVNFEPSTSSEADQRDVFAALTDNTIRFRSETLVFDTDDSKDDSGGKVSQVNGVIGAPAFAVGPYTHPMIKDLMERLTTAEARLSACENKIGVKGKSDSSSGAASSNPPASKDAAQGGSK